MNVASQPGPRRPLDQESMLTPAPANDVRERGWPFSPALELLARSIEPCHKLGDRGDRPEVLIGLIRGTKLNGELRFQKADQSLIVATLHEANLDAFTVSLIRHLSHPSEQCVLHLLAKHGS